MLAQVINLRLAPVGDIYYKEGMKQYEQTGI